MNRSVYYVLLLLIYLGIAKGLAPSEFGIDYIRSSKDLSRIIPGAPLTAILIDTHSTGFIIKTYYQKYRIIYGFQTVEELIVKTSRNFAESSKENIGLSLFRRSSHKKENFTPVPPGSLYIGNKEYGYWKYYPKNLRYWKFYRVYRNLPKFFGWGNFKPNKIFHSNLKEALKQGTPFIGEAFGFGPTGELTQKAFPEHFQNNLNNKITLSQLLKNYFKTNY